MVRCALQVNWKQRKSRKQQISPGVLRGNIRYEGSLPNNVMLDLGPFETSRFKYIGKSRQKGFYSEGERSNSCRLMKRFYIENGH